MGKLTAIAIKTAMGTGTLHDGEGVRLQMRGIGKGSWIFRFQLKGRTREMGLGTYPEVTLAEARQKAADARKLTRAGIDPIEARKTADREAGTARRPTFEQAAEELIKAKEKGWGNPKTAYRWRARLRDYAFPIIGKKDCAAITASDVVRCLSPIWYDKTETAVKTRGYVEAVLDYAGVKGWRERGQNPAAWRGNLEHLGLRARKDFDAVEHHPAMPYADLPAFMIRLRTQTAFTARALEFLEQNPIRLHHNRRGQSNWRILAA
jgi:hypothetical protein